MFSSGFDVLFMIVKHEKTSPLVFAFWKCAFFSVYSIIWCVENKCTFERIVISKIFMKAFVRAVIRGTDSLEIDQMLNS